MVSASYCLAKDLPGKCSGDIFHHWIYCQVAEALFSNEGDLKALNYICSMEGIYQKGKTFGPHPILGSAALGTNI